MNHFSTRRQSAVLLVQRTRALLRRLNQQMTRRPALTTGLTAFALYAASLSITYAPGASALHLARHLGAHPFPSLTDPLWGWSMRLLALISGGAPWLLNLFSAACVATAVGLLIRTLLQLKPASGRGPTETADGQTYAAIAGGIYLAICTPVWVIATRAHPLALDTLLTTAVWYGLSRYRINRRPIWLYGSTALIGVCLVEFPSMYLMAPFLAALILFLLFIRRQLTTQILIQLAKSLALGMLLYVPATLQYLYAPSLPWREIDGLIGLFIEVLREQYVGIKYSLPSLGWLTTAILTVLPCSIALLYRLRPAYQAGIRSKRWLLIAVVMSALAAMLLNFPLAPWALTQGSPVLVTPYLLAALAFGLLLAHIEAVWWPRRRIRRYIAPTVSVLAALLLISTLTRAYPAVSRKGNAAVTGFTQATLNSLQGQTWLIPYGDLDPLLMLEAHRQKRTLHLLNPSEARHDYYRAYFADALADTRLADLLSIRGLAAMLNEWATRPEIVDQLAIMASGAWWSAQQLDPMISGLLYLGVQHNHDGAWIETESGAFLNFWKTYRPRYEALRRANGSTAYDFFPFIRQHLSRVANNLGVAAEEHPLPTAASELYQTALQIDPDNTSARINSVGLTDRAAQRAALTDAVRQLPAGASITDVERLYGAIRAPDLHAPQPIDAIQQSKGKGAITGTELPRESAESQPTALQKDDENSARYLERLQQLEEPGPRGRQLIAQELIAANQPAEARRILTPLLAASQPPDLDVLRLALHINIMLNDDLEERDILAQKIIALEPSNPMANYLMATQRYQAGYPDEAIAMLRVSLAGLQNPVIMNDLAYLLNEQGETDEAEALIQQAIQLKSDFGSFWGTLALIQLNQDKADEAIASLARAREIDPDNVAFDIIQLQLYLHQNQGEEAEALSRRLLAEDAGLTERQRQHVKDLMQ